MGRLRQLPGAVWPAGGEELVTISRAGFVVTLRCVALLLAAYGQVDCSVEGWSPVCPGAHRSWGDPESGRVHAHVTHMPEESPCEPS